MSLDVQQRVADAEPDLDPAPELNPAAVEAFAERVFGLYTGGMVTYMIDVGYRTGLLESLARGPATTEALAARSGVVERYTREWLGALASAGIVTYDAASGTYALPAEHAACLTGRGGANLAPQSQITTLLATFVPRVADAFRTGGGVPYAAYRPEFTDVMDGLSRGVLDDSLVPTILPLAGDLPARLAKGIRVVDIGCGTGHSTNLLAQHHPSSTFVGYDIAADALEQARAEAAAWGLDNVTFEALDVGQLPSDPAFGAVFAFDTIHDLVDPVGTVERVWHALAPGGTFVVYDVRASSDLEGNLDNPLAPFLYAVSTLHCMTVSLSEGGAGLGTAWGQQRALAMLREAGFNGVEAHDLPDDPLNCVYVAHKPTT